MTWRTKVLVGVLGVIILALAILQTPLLQSARRAAWGFTVVAAGKLMGIGPLDLDSDVTAQMQKLQTENIRLKSENEDYVRLRRQLGSPSFDNLQAIPATVAAHPLDVFRTELILNRGGADGITLQAPVIVQGSMLLGFITDVSDHTAVVRLLLDPGTSLPGEVAGQDHSRGLVEGRQYTSVVLSTVPRDAQIKAGEMVVTTAQNQTPQGLLIGKINRVTNVKNEAYQEADVELPYDVDDVRAVNVLVAP